MPHNLRRTTSGASFIPEIDGLRFLAIVPVVFLHFGERWLRANAVAENTPERSIADILTHFHIGVYIFFAVSGFILALPFGKATLNQDQPVSLKKYFIRRLTRLEPPYIVIMTLLFMVLVIIKHQDFFELLPHYAASIFYVHRFIYEIWTPINPPAWTLEIEVQFYLVAPFITVFYFKMRDAFTRRAIMISIIAGKLVLYNLTMLVDPLFRTLPFSIEFFLIGILLADIFLTNWKNGITHHWVYDVVGIVSFAGLFVTWSWAKDMILSFIFIACVFFTFYGAFRGIVFTRILRNPWVSAIGGMCYTIYLLHLAFAEFFVSAFRHFLPSIAYIPGLILGLVIFLPLLFLVSAIFFMLLEKPCMDPRWPARLMGWLKGVPKAPLQKIS